jgi:hypothetical protein
VPRPFRKPGHAILSRDAHDQLEQIAMTQKSTMFPSERPPENPVLAVDSFEAARLLGIGERHLRNLARLGTVQSVRLGRRTLYPVDGLKAALAPCSKAEG